ncbi:6-O-methylguanine DNA methyltransferase, partial [Vararia minispora EC-137]
VYRVVRMIPEARVTSYGHVAKLIGMPRHARHVGQALKFVSPVAGVPWQRVVQSTGTIARREPGGAERQRRALEAEGVPVRVGRSGEFVVDFSACGWFPDPDEIPHEQEEGERREGEGGAEVAGGG